MMPFAAYLRENFKRFCLELLEKSFLLEDIVNIKNECLISLRSCNAVGEAVTNLPRTASREICLPTMGFEPRTFRLRGVRAKR